METGFSKRSIRILNPESLWSSRAHRAAYYALLLALFSHILVVGLLCSTPPISRDALIHHLAIPKLWLKHGGFYETPWALYSYYPMNIDLLYLVALYFKNDIAPKFIHFAFGLGTGLLVYLYLKKRLTRNWGLLGMLIYISTPIVIRLSASAYVDLGLVFFTTAGILAFIRWQDSNYEDLRWLVLSAMSMGLGLGTKYSALLAFFFLNLMVVYYYARHRRHQVTAVKYGIMFFLIAAIIASPWYVKNYLLTGNPFYPLFDSFFNPSHYVGGREQGGTLGFFQRRALMYKESFWATLSIPLRMFFQGKDDTYQYFDGILNPILIVFLPFSLINKDFRRDKIFFVTFIVFFMIMAFFLTAKQVRYILPVIPFLTILAIIGIKNILDKLIRPTPSNPPQIKEKLQRLHSAFQYIGYIAFISVVGILLIFNFVYLKNQFANIQPLKYILNRESRPDFLSRHLASYPAMNYINNHTSTEAKIFFMFVGNRGYYLNRTYYHDRSFGMNTLNAMVKASQDEHDFLACLKSLGCTHILTRTALFNKYLQDNFKNKVILRFMGLKKYYWKPIYESSGYTVYKISHSAGNLRRPDQKGLTL